MTLLGKSLPCRTVNFGETVHPCGTEMPGSLPPVVVDRVLLQQVILNLMMNAVEAMRAVSDRVRVLRIRTEEQSSGNIVVLIQDSGLGVGPEHSSRMFEPFY